jgi:hypothetical protein
MAIKHPSASAPPDGYGINLSGRRLSVVADVLGTAGLGWPRTRIDSLAVSINVPQLGLATPGILPRMRISWAGGGSVNQSIVADLRSAVVVVPGNSVIVEAWIEQDLESNWGVVVPTPITLPQGTSLVIGRCSPGRTSSTLIYSGWIADTTADLGPVPNFAKSVGLWEPRPITPNITAPPFWNGGIVIASPNHQAANEFYHIPIGDCWNKFAPLGPAGTCGQAAFWGAAATVTTLQACFELGL